jgi:hypothetical protein
MIDMVFIVMRALSMTGLVMVLQHHIHLDWWEGGVLGFSGMMLLGTLYDVKR